MAERPSAPSGLHRTSWQRRFATWIVVALVIVVLWLIGAAIIPRWWAQRVANVVDGSLTTGGLYGFFIGFVFTLLPIGALALAFRMRSARRTWKGWVGWLVAAAVLAMPNLMTLGIVLGNGKAAHDGDRILSVSGNGFRMWSLIGAIVAGVAVLVLAYLVKSRGWFRDDSRRLRNEAAERR